MPPAFPKVVGLGVVWALAYQPALRFDEGPVDAVHLVVEATGVAQVVPRPIPPPEWGGHGSTVDTLSAFREVIEHIYWVGSNTEESFFVYSH